jgi:hypothetical protein
MAGMEEKHLGQKRFWTVMLNGPAWEDAHKSVRRTKGKDLDKMPEDELREHLDLFKVLTQDYQK